MTNYIKNIQTDFLKIDALQMIEVDRLMIADYGIDLIQMMENAGRCLAILARERFFDGDVEGKHVVILAGRGGNGGGALVAARRLHNWGARVQVFISTEAQSFTSIPRHQLDILTRMGIPINLADEMLQQKNIDLIIDGIIGYSLNGNPYGFAAGMIQWANSQEAPILSLDTPSGLDLTNGTLYDPIIRASATLTLAMPKKGLFYEDAKNVIGELYLGDISVPIELYKEKSLDLVSMNIFKYSDIVKIF